ncbi:MAG: calcium-binding protein [Gemmatimonas sp.]
MSRSRPDSLPVLVVPAPSLATPIASADTSPPANANAGSLTRNTMGGREGNRTLSDAMREQSLGFRNDAPSEECLSEGDSFGSWELRFTGYGCVGLSEGDGALKMAPMSATANDETHAPLILGPQYGDRLMMTARVETVQQLRKNGDPNAWEVAWVIWNYTDDEHFYYFIPKPNGWELGKRDPAYPGGQRFLATGTEQTFPVGRAYNVQVVQRGNVSTVMVDGLALTSFADTERPYVAGRIGVYSEDAAIKVHGVKVRTGSF